MDDEVSELSATMMQAAAKGDVAKVRAQLAAGARPSAGNPIGQTALHIAAIWNHVEVGEVLIEAGADVNARNKYGATPLHFAAQKDNLEIGKLLVEKGADTKVRGGNGALPWEAASGELRILLGGPSNAMHAAVKNLDLAKLQSLLDQGGDMTELDARGRSPVHMAALATVVIADADKGCGDDSCKDQQCGGGGGGNPGLTALQMLMDAAKLCGENTAQAACNVRDGEGMSALHMLVKGGHLGGAALLLSAGANANLQTRPTDDEYRSGQWGRTNADGTKEVLRAADDKSPLHLAIGCEEPNQMMISLLLDHGANPNVRDVEQRTTLHLALDFDDDLRGVDLPLAEMLLKKGADPSLGSNEIGMANTCVHAAVDHSEIDVLRLLLRYGAPHSSPGKGGYTPLALAARSGAIAAVLPLLEAGADPDAPTPAGKSARELAVINKRTKVIEAFDAKPARG